jgi:hypothetical protein
VPAALEVAVTVNVYEPAAEGVPEIEPEVDIVDPVGSAPDDTA